MWIVDYGYGVVFRTYRLDVVEFTPLPEMSGTQMLWRNPQGFHCKSGEFVKIKIPWLPKGGKEWHPFSLYLREATKEGIQETRRTIKEQRLPQEHLSFLEPTPEEKMENDPETTALLLIEMQNEYASPNGKLHNAVKDVMENNKMLDNISKLVDAARETGAHVFHAPMIVNSEINIDRDVFYYRDDSLFKENTWNAEIIDRFKPKDGDCVVKNKSEMIVFVDLI